MAAEILTQPELNRAIDLLDRGLVKRLDSIEQKKLANTIRAIAAMKGSNSGALVTLRIQSTGENHYGFCRKVTYTATVKFQIPTGNISHAELMEARQSAVSAYEMKLDEDIAALLIEVADIRARAERDAAELAEAGGEAPPAN